MFHSHLCLYGSQTRLVFCYFVTMYQAQFYSVFVDVIYGKVGRILEITLVVYFEEFSIKFWGCMMKRFGALNN